MSPPRPGKIDIELRGRVYPLSFYHRPGDGETLLYLHGLGSDKDDFLGAWDVPEWTGHALLALDAPGCGATRTYYDEVPLGMDDLVDAMWALVRALDLRDLTVIGHSMGGLAGLLFALRNGETVRRFVTVEGNLGPEDCSVFSRRVFRERFLGREAAFMRDLGADLAAAEGAGFAVFASRFRDRVHPRAFFDYCRSIVDYSDRFLLLDRFVSDLDVPRLYVHGSENAHLTHIPRLVRDGIPVACVPGSNHFPVQSNAPAYYRVLADFVRDT